jgi:RNA polymerase sigma factor (sigma-70 family)
VIAVAACKNPLAALTATFADISIESECEVQRLVDAARLGNSDASQQIYERYVGRIYRTIRTLCPTDAEAEEVTQDVFVHALTHLHYYEARPQKGFAAWLMTVALNRARRARAYLRRWEPRPTDALQAIADEEVSAADPAEAILRRLTLLRILESIPVRDREVLALYYGAELTAQEVGRITRLQPTNVRKIVQRRRQELQQWINGEGGTP